MYRYMSMKQNDEAKAVVEEFQKFFLVEETYELDDDEDESESNTTMADDGGHRRRKRAWTHSSCSDWGHSTYYNIIQSSSQFNSDKSSHNRRRHCLAYKYIGVSKANAKMYGGMFAGRHSSNGRYKLFTKLVGRAQLFSKTFDVGTILSYRIKSSSGSITQRNYMVIAGKSLLDSKSTSCTTRTWAYEHNFYIPIYKINIWVASIDVGAQIRPRFEMNFICTSSSNTVITKVQPKAILRVGASAQASLAKLVRGGLTIGINLNFYVETVTESVPCIAGYYGYDPMSISIEAWYQFRSKVKVQFWPPKIKWTWGKRYTWRPSSLKWKITSGYRRSWLSRRCDGSTPLGPLLTNAAKQQLRGLFSG
ncbi:PREDICTED: uncharacterized protein LOC106811281 isoform X2 [Priapulus caudatus]|uniref:Uncharacterized protein LOC106811281 isoform X2 n=1 Tax=Priapulus caudatus TaxID=37621 RepID=A0ABM1EDR4_PRICU|nr:PREDICTED: uncharacterized protein LOC106811281 isoform X2 [Priapulus caudatus]